MNPISAHFNLSTDAILIKVGIKLFTGRKKDTQSSDDVASAASASADAVSCYLSSLDKADRLPIQQIATAARNYLDEQTATWDSAGWRLLNNSRYEEVRQKLDCFYAAFVEARDVLVARRDELAEKSLVLLGSLANRAPFPTADQLADAYTFSVETAAITNPSDIRLRHVAPAAAAAIAESVRKEQGAKTQDALKQLVQRLLDTVEHAATKLSEEDAIFRDTLIGNVKAVCELVPALNLTGDPFITRLGKEVAEIVAKLDPQVLRENKGARKEAAAAVKEVAGKAKSLLEKLKSGAVSAKA